MIQVEITYNINIPKLDFSEYLEHIAGQIIIPDIIKRVKQHKAIDGGLLPENGPATIKRKGHGRQLQDTGLLLDSIGFYNQGKNTTIISIRPERHEIGGYLQHGIRTLNGYKKYKFFGISVFAYRKAMAYMREQINRLIDG